MTTKSRAMNLFNRTYRTASVSAPGMSGRGALAAAVAALFLSACANYAGIKSDKQIATPLDTNLGSSQSLAPQGGQWPSTDWAKQFGDPQLPQLIDEALAGNPS